jgi:hypothetical protein
MVGQEMNDKNRRNMKKISIKIMTVMSLMLLILGCDGVSTEDPSTLTYYVTFELVGGEVVTVPLGTTYVEPGVRAYENDVDVSSSVTTEGTADGSRLGVYTVNYSAVNGDGFASTATRTVIVYDPATLDLDISGAYTLAEGSHRLVLSSGVRVDYDGYPVTIVRMAQGVFSVSDYFAGYYERRAGYGRNYAMTGYISLNADTTLSLLSSHVNGWGDSLDELTDGRYDVAGESLSWGAVYAGAYSFNVILTK